VTRVAVVSFPGTNCEFDVIEALDELGIEATLVAHTETSLAGHDACVLPGGFSFGDYLRAGAIARFTPIMGAVADFAASGRPVLGICNGFQILCEAGLLPGALQKNAGLRFVCRNVEVMVPEDALIGRRRLQRGEAFVLPVNHFDGNYTTDPETLARLHANGQIVLRYLENPNGSVDDIAGVANEAGNVVGIMPHPERAGFGFGLTAPVARLLRDLVAD
jgi:phosphoribosylformylglycinamidine synthase I